MKNKMRWEKASVEKTDEEKDRGGGGKNKLKKRREKPGWGKIHNSFFVDVFVGMYITWKIVENIFILTSILETS